MTLIRLCDLESYKFVDCLCNHLLPDHGIKLIKPICYTHWQFNIFSSIIRNYWNYVSPAWLAWSTTTAIVIAVISQIISLLSILHCQHQRHQIFSVSASVWYSSRFCPWSSSFYSLHTPHSHIISRASVNYKLYADDTQLYLSFSPCNFPQNIQLLQNTLS